MPESVDNNNLEKKIMDVARSLFIEKGYAETSMSEIASRVGINRPALHYYFRTKDKMFRAVFGMIVQSIIPKVQDIVMRKDEPISRRIENIVDTYYVVFRENPCLPLFVFREMNRDIDFLLDVIESSKMKASVDELVASLKEEMEQGRLNAVPLRFLFYTFYSLLTCPFLTKDLGSRMFLESGETFDDMLGRWKSYIVFQMENLLHVRQ